jgi:hypothetical protein
MPKTKSSQDFWALQQTTFYCFYPIQRFLWDLLRLVVALSHT